MNAPTASHSLTVRIEIRNEPGMLGKVTSAIGKAGGDIGAIDLVAVGQSTVTRDPTSKASDERHSQRIVEVRARRFNDQMKVAAPHALASIVGKSELSEEYITPSMFDSRVVPMVAAAVAEAAVRTGVARKKRR